jgi:hypothetical protein
MAKKKHRSTSQRANVNQKPESQPTHRQAQQHAHRQPSAEIVSVPARIIEQDRKTSLTVINALTNTALAISEGENAIEKMSVLKDLWAMQKEAEDRQAEREFNTAKVLCAMRLPTIPKSGLREFTDKKNQLQSSSYSTLDDIEGVLDPICRDVGLVREYSSRSNDKGWACQILTIRHVGGYKEVYESPYMPLDTSGSKNNQQGAGSVAKYGRRYALIGAFNIFHVDEDTDAATVTGAPKEDKFAARVEEEAAKQEPPKGTQPLSLPEAAAALESKLRNLPVEKRADVMMKNIAIIGAMENDAELSAKAVELRKLCEEGAL